MRVSINGQEESLEDGLTVAELLRQLNVEPMRVAVEINKELAPRTTFATTVIQAGDNLEIVTFVGGG